MNIDDYRAMKAELEKEGADVDAQTEPSANEDTTSVQTQDEQVPESHQEEVNGDENNQVQQPSQETLDEENQEEQKIEIDGVEYTLDEIKNGYMRQSDYTKKTQELRAMERQTQEAMQFVETIRANPKLAKELSKEFELPTLDPDKAKLQDIENRYYDLLIEKEISELQKQYGDFNIQEVLTVARDNNLSDLDTAYHVVQSRTQSKKPPVDVDKLKEQLRDEIMKEVKSHQESNVDTSSVIQSGGGTEMVKDNRPTLSAQEMKVAQGMGLSPSEYAKWRDSK